MNEKFENESNFLDTFEDVLRTKGFDVDGGSPLSDKQDDIFNSIQKQTKLIFRNAKVNLNTDKLEDLYYMENSQLRDFIFNEVFEFMMKIAENVNRKIGTGLTNREIANIINSLYFHF